MKRLSLALWCHFFLIVQAGRAAAEPMPEPSVCATAEACLQELRNVSGNKRGISPADEALVQRLLSFGPDIVPALVDMLADPNESAATLAAYGLRDIEYIDAQFLPQIKSGLDRKLRWLAPALCRIDGDEVAREAVARFIESDSAPHNQEAYALKVCGRRALPHIVEAARCRDGCDRATHGNLAYVLGEMGEVRTEAGPGLLQIARDATAPRHVATGTLYMISALGADGLRLEPELIELRKLRPELAPSIDNALIGIGSTAGVQVIIERLSTSPNVLTLRDLARLGSSGEDAGPTVVALLDHDAWDIRIAAARALGYIGYAEAAAPLTRLLDDPRDVRLNWVAAESLGRLHAAGAVAALRVTAATHWYPPVRRSAARAVENIKQLKPIESVWPEANFPIEFFEFERMGTEQLVCEHPVAKVRPESREQKLVASNAAGALDRLAYNTEEFSYGPAVPRETKGKDDGSTIEATRETMVEHRELVERVPDVALRVDGGWLAGSDRGEWGGELVFIDDGGAVEVLLAENVEDIYSFGNDVIALTGMAHMISNRGAVYILSRDSSGKWSSHPWRALPGAPETSWLVESGEVLINVVGGGTLLLSQDGTFRVAPCTESETETRVIVDFFG